MNKTDEEIARQAAADCFHFVGSDPDDTLREFEAVILSALREQRNGRVLEIELTRGKKTIVSPEDFDFLSQWKWHCTDKGRAARTIYTGPNSKSITVYMHRVI